MLYHGKNDDVINYEFTLKAYKKLKSMGFEIQYSLSDFLAHGIDENGLKKGEVFLKKVFCI